MKKHVTHHDDCGCLSKKKDAEIEKLRKKFDRTLSALRAINTWASFRGGIALVPKDTEKLTEKVLREVGAWKS